MLPQIGFIVAQAGADARLPPLPSAPPGNPTGIGNPQQSPMHYPHGASPTVESSAQRDEYSAHHRPYHTRHHSPPPPLSAAASALPPPPVLPPPVPYMYSSDFNHKQTVFPSYDRQTLPLPPPPSSSSSSTSQPSSFRNGTVPTSSSYRPPSPSKLREDPYHEPAPSTTFHSESASTAPAPFPHVPKSTYHAPTSMAHPSTTSKSVWHTPPPPAYAAFEHHVHDDPYHPQYGSRWDHQDTAVSEGKVIRRLRDCNDLMTTMNSEFWENSESIYQSKLQSLQDELRRIQEGTHEGFIQEVTELEKDREKILARAKTLRDIVMADVEHQYGTDMSSAREDYENERHSLYDTLLAAVDDRRKLIREDRDNGSDIKDLFRDVQHRFSNRRNVRRRGHHVDRLHASSSPSRHDVTLRRRQPRVSAPYNIHAGPNAKEDDELESDLAIMRGLPTKRTVLAGVPSRK